jgi:hypothetical protein
MKNIFTLVVFLIIVCNQFVYAKETHRSKNKNSGLTDKFQFDVGVFYPVKTIKIGANGSGPNDMINFGESFDMRENQITPYFSFGWRFAKKWVLNVEYFKLNGSNGLELEEDINWKDNVYTAGAYVKAGFGFGLFRVFAGRVFLKGSNYEFGGGIGVHTMNVSAFIEGEAYVDNIYIGLDRSYTDAVLPLPNIGLWYSYALNTKWLFSAHIDWFGIKIGEYSGTLWDIYPKVNYQITKHFGLSASYKYVNIIAKVNKTYWNGKLVTTFQGPTFAVYFNF